MCGAINAEKGCVLVCEDWKREKFVLPSFFRHMACDERNFKVSSAGGYSTYFDNERTM